MSDDGVCDYVTSDAVHQDDEDEDDSQGQHNECPIKIKCTWSRSQCDICRINTE